MSSRRTHYKALLPPAFADLEQWVGTWALDTERARRDLRCQSEMAALEAYYHALLPRMEALIQHLNGFPLDALPPPESNLLKLGQSFLEVAPAVELFHAPQVPDGFPWQRFEVLT